MKKLSFNAGIVLVLLASFLLLRTFLFISEDVAVRQAVEIAIDGGRIARNLSGALRFQTLSHQDPGRFDGKPFQALHRFLEETFPSVHTSLGREVVNDYSLLYSWEGSDPSLRPILLMAHQDVVPVIPGTGQEWAYPPFDGRIAEGYIWGRGALDVKSGMMGMLEAVEALLQDGFRPKRTFFLAFGHDEEVGGSNGAEKIAELLASRKVRFEYVLDEGGAILRDVIPGLEKPAALVGIAEKGYLSLELSVVGEGGHSSMPPKHTAVGILSRAVTRLEENPFKSNMTHMTRLLDDIGPEMPFARRVVLANLWLFGPWVESRLSESPRMNAGIRTTTAATMFQGSVKDNILPVRATAVVNFRIMPDETVESVIESVGKTIDDPGVRLRPIGYHGNPSPVSDIHSKSYQLLRETIHQVAAGEDLIVAPYLVVGATDSRYFTGLSSNVYRFLFNEMGSDDLKRVHGTNERISVKDYLRVVTFYYQLLRNSEEL